MWEHRVDPCGVVCKMHIGKIKSVMWRRSVRKAKIVMIRKEAGLVSGCFYAQGYVAPTRGEEDKDRSVCRM